MAGSNDLIWLHGKANVPGNPEKICPGRHVRQNEWQPEWNDMYLPPNGEGDRYDYISDYECIFNHPVSHVVCYTAVFSVVTQRSSWGGTLRDDTKNGCVADYESRG